LAGISWIGAIVCWANQSSVALFGQVQSLLGQAWRILVASLDGQLLVELTEIQSHSLDRAKAILKGWTILVTLLDKDDHSWGRLKFGLSLQQGRLLTGVNKLWL